MRGQCPEEAEIAGFVQGTLSADREAGVESHLDGCDACSQLVAELVRIFTESQVIAEPHHPSADESPPSDAAGSGEGEASGAAEVPSSAASGGNHSGGAGLQSQELAVTLGPDDAPISRPIGVMLSAGAEVGRYRVLECVGVGGMGVVYAAYDPELDRRVALKLLRGSEGDPETATRNGRLLREAQALARLSHPNVITVHDVGTWKDQVFVAMEFVQGGTLEAWLREEKRTWPEIRDVFVAAGRGLAAAHAAGMVHRDFKPENVLIGLDGRVRVTDFGLARRSDRNSADLIATDELEAISVVSSLGSLSAAKTPVVSLTETGVLVGTPAYMAPEQYEQRQADAATDQFAFCVAFYEGLHGERPFAGRTLAELASNVLDGKVIESSSDLVVPRSVRQALRRGLSRRRRDRFASMEELLAVIERRAGRRWWLAAGLGAVVAAAGAGVWAYGTTEPLHSPFCEDDRGLASVWAPQRRGDIRKAFEATELEYAEQSAERFVGAVDEYVEGWEALRARSCGPEGLAEGPAIIALRERCLGRRKVALGAMLEIYEQPDTPLVSRAVGAVAGLPAIDSCADAETLMGELPPPVPLEQRGEVEEVRDELARTTGLIAAGRYAEGLVLARELDGRAEVIGHRPLRAETRLMLGRLLDRMAESEAANTAFEEAVLMGIASRYRRVVAEALIHQVFVLGVALPRMEEAHRVAARAEAEIEGANMGAEGMGPLLVNRASLAYRSGDVAGAVELARQALALKDREREPLRWADAAFNLATFQMVQGDPETAVAQFEAYAQIYEEELGSMHPEVASGYQNLGVAYYNAGKLPEARAALERAEATRRVALRPNHPQHASTLNMLGTVALGEDKPEVALEYVERGIAMLEADGIDPLEIADNRVDYAAALLALERIDEAERQMELVFELQVPALGADHHKLATAHHVRAEIAAARGDEAGLRHHMARAREIQVGVVGEDHPEVDRIDIDRVVLLADLGKEDEARQWLHEYLERRNEGGEPSYTVLHAHFSYADLLWADADQRPLAREHAARALEGFTSGGYTSSADDTREWMAKHP